MAISKPSVEGRLRALEERVESVEREVSRGIGVLEDVKMWLDAH